MLRQSPPAELPGQAALPTAHVELTHGFKDLEMRWKVGVVVEGPKRCKVKKITFKKAQERK